MSQTKIVRINPGSRYQSWNPQPRETRYIDRIAITLTFARNFDRILNYRANLIINEASLLRARGRRDPPKHNFTLDRRSNFFIYLSIYIPVGHTRVSSSRANSRRRRFVWVVCQHRNQRYTYTRTLWRTDRPLQFTLQRY